jgi:cold shock CspA family protein
MRDEPGRPSSRACAWRESDVHFQRIAITLWTGIVLMGSCESAWAQRTKRVSLDSSGTEGDDSSTDSSISADGRFVAFTSYARNLVSGDTNGTYDVFVRDRLTGTTERVSVDSAGTEANGGSGTVGHLAISADGQAVAFTSAATNLVSGDTNGVYDVFVHDRRNGTTERASMNGGGAEGNDSSFDPSISADGRFVAFASAATNLAGGDINGVPDIFVRDRQTKLTECVSVDSSLRRGNDWSYQPNISADGRFVAFTSRSTNLVSGDTNLMDDVFVHDRQSGTTDRASVDSAGNEANSSSGYYASSISADGQFVAFESEATNLVSGDNNGSQDVFVHDRQTGTTERVSVDSAGTEGNSDSGYSGAEVSADGRFVAFDSRASNLVPRDTNHDDDIFVRDRQAGATTRVDVNSGGGQAKNGCHAPAISADGRSVSFFSFTDNLVKNDTNGREDVFVHGPYLTLEADPPSPPAGVTLTFATWSGQANGPSLLVAIDVNGTPMFTPLVSSSFDAVGVWMLSATVPAGLSGSVITFETLGIIRTGKVDISNPFAVSFQ